MTTVDALAEEITEWLDQVREAIRSDLAHIQWLWIERVSLRWEAVRQSGDVRLEYTPLCQMFVAMAGQPCIDRELNALNATVVGPREREVSHG